MNCPRCGSEKTSHQRRGKPYLLCHPCASEAQRHRRKPQNLRVTTCSRCGLEKTVVLGKSRMQYVCRPCARATTIAWNVAHPDAQTVRYQVDPARGAADRRERRARNPIQDSFTARRGRAERAGTIFTITIDEIGEPTNCGCCDRVLIWKGGNSSPSLDRIDSSQGYISGNVAWLCHRCNRIKNDGTPDDFRRILAYIEKHLQEKRQ